MSSTRNKRKRSENDGGTITPPSRRRSREQRAAADPDEKKNEESDKEKDSNVKPSQKAPKDAGKDTKPLKKMKSSESDDEASGRNAKNKKQGDSDEDAEIGDGSASASEAKKALHLSEDVDEVEDRESKIRGLLSHRSVLLEKIRLCRTMAEKRLSNGVNKTSEEAKKEPSDEEEIAKFREISMQAIQTAKKSRSESETVERRTSLSLRRGSSVGKRMNAALSSLSPGHGGHATADVTSAQTPVSLQASKTISKAQQGVSSLSNKKLAQISSSSQSIKGIQYSNGNTTKPPKSSSQTFSGKQQNSSGTVRSLSSKNPKGTSNSNRTSSASRPDPMSMPLHFGSGMSGLPPNRLAHPPVHFPEAMVLREKRQSIEMRLKELLEKRVQTANDLEMQNGPSVTMVHSRQPPELPRRRKTHWDVLLQEMSWMASDFIEERKWKVSAARTIASAIPKPDLLATSSPASLAAKAGRENEDKMETDTAQEGSGKEKEDSAAAEIKKSTKSKRARKKSKPTVQREYQSLTLGNVESCRNVGRILSAMIFELGKAMIDAGTMGKTDEYHRKALGRFQKSRSDILNEKSEASDDNETTTDIIESEAEATKSKFTNDIEIENGLNHAEPVEEHSFESISEHVEKIRSSMERNTKSASTDITDALEVGKLNLTLGQKETMNFVEKAWTASPSQSAIIAGHPLSGKTITTCSILWKQKSKGPQVLICSPASVFRWKYELSRFVKMRALTFGLSAGISAVDLTEEICEELLAGDVIVCEISSAKRLAEALQRKKTKVQAIVIDCRHASSFFGSLDKSVQSDLNSINRWNGPSDLISTVWWNEILKLSLQMNPRLLLIEYSDSDTFSLSKSGLRDVQQLEILGCRAACLIGPHRFQSAHSSIERRVISWARKKGKARVADKVARVRMVLKATLEAIYFQMPESLKMNPVSWELRRCDLTSDQRLEYDKCCSEVRGALASSQSTSNSFHAVSKAIFRLREYCFHSESNENLAVGSSAQPDIAHALDLLQGSAKLRELISILKFECRYKLPYEEMLKPHLNARPHSRSSSGSKNDGNTRKKIVILAVLPQLQNSISILLNALGVRHDTLDKTASAGPSGESHQIEEKALAWLKHQTILSRFKQDRDDEDSLPSSDIIVASPASLAGWNQGLGIEDADVVVSLDEDWTGRGDFILGSLVARLQTYKSFTKRRLQLIRLICADTIEDKLFSDCGKIKESVVSTVCRWPCDNAGFFVLPDSKTGAVSLYEQATASISHESSQFPAMKMMRLRDKLLADILLPSISLPPVFNSGSEIKFLPRLGNSTEGMKENTEVALIQALLDIEKLASISYGSSMKSVDNIVSFEERDVEALALLDSKDLPKEVMTRQDLKSLMALFYFEKQCKLQETSSAHLPLAQLPNATLTGPLVSMKSATHHSDDDSDFADSWLKSGISFKADDQAASLLVYQSRSKEDAVDTDEASDSDSPGDSTKENDPSKDLTEPKRRFNAYAKLFSSCWDGNIIHDGNQGSEPLVYFPPLFHGMLEYHSKAKSASKVQALKDSMPSIKEENETSATLSTIKRKEGPPIEPLNAKRMRLEENPSISEGVLMPDAPKSNVGAGHTTMGMDLAKVPPSTSVKPPEPERMEDNDTDSAAPSEQLPFLSDEDYGLLGAGDIPLPSASAVFASRKTAGVGETFSSNSTNTSHDFISDLFPCDVEESQDARTGADTSLNSMLLFVKKRPIALNYRTSQGQLAGDPVSALQGIKLMNGEDAGKKGKKKHPSQSFLGVGKQNQRQPLPFSTSSALQLASAKDADRRRLHSSYASRHFGTGLSMFESASFRVASLQVEKRVLKRIAELGWNSPLSYDAGPGLPLQSSLASKVHSPLLESDSDLAWTKLAKPLDIKSNMEDSVILLSSRQRAALKSSLVSPCRVDFGPGAGYLASTSGMTGIAPPRSRLGVSLPMGVKVPQPTIEQTESPWTAETERILQNSVAKFGMNWMLVARAVTGFEGMILNENFMSESRGRIKSFPKSARQCRDQWQSLARKQISLASDVRKSEKAFRESATLRSSKIPGDNATTIANTSVCKQSVIIVEQMVHHEKDPDADTDSNKVNDLAAVPEGKKDLPVDKPKEKGRFAALIASRSKRKYAPVSTPGAVGGGQQNQIVASHHSHMQSVQSSVAAQWASGRTEMWPLQILDFADKQRAGSRTPPDSASHSSGSARRQPKSGNHSSRTPPTSQAQTSRDRSFPAVSSTSSRKSVNSRSPVPGKPIPNRAPPNAPQSRPQGKSSAPNISGHVPLSRPPGSASVAKTVPGANPAVAPTGSVQTGIVPSKAAVPSAKTPSSGNPPSAKQGTSQTTSQANIPPKGTGPTK